MRWSLRDLRNRWGLVTAIAIVIAIGTGTYGPMKGTATWRRLSNDASFALTRMHDLRVELTPGEFVPAGRIDRAVRATSVGDDVVASVERLNVAVQIDASVGANQLLVPGELVGSPAGADVDKLHMAEGRPPRGAVAAVERSFAAQHDLPVEGTLRISGGGELRYAGHASAPEYFYVIGRSGLSLAPGSTLIVFATRAAVGDLTGQPGRVNNLVLRLREGSDRAAAADRLEAELREAGLATTVTTREEDPSYNLLYEDIDGDQQFYNVFAFLILGGATLAAFNLTSRIVDAQRREIGVGMALGVTPRRIAVRPLLVGLEVALIGVIAGVVLGLVIGSALGSLFREVLPLPVWRTPFQVGPFVLAAALGVVVPTLASAIPVWRAVRIEPIDAIRPIQLTARRGQGLLRAGRLPGRSYLHLPVRNLLRAPRRALLTALGVAAAVTILVALLGMLDSFFETIRAGEAELTREAPDRLIVDLDRFHPVTDATVQRVEQAAGPARVHTGLRVPLRLSTARDDIEVVAELIDFAHGPWRPDVPGPPDGIVLSKKAAGDLGVDPGGTVDALYPKRVGTTFQAARSELRVAATHHGPARPIAYLDLSEASRFGLAATTNLVQVVPGPAQDEDELTRALFDVPGVTSVSRVDATGRAIREAFDEYTSILRVIELVALALALLIAFNSAGISLEERRRDHATMFAFGLPVRTVLGLTALEGAVIGVVATAIGIAAGFGVVRWVATSLLTRTLPELSLTTHLTPTTLVTSAVVGVLAVVVATLLTGPRLRKMDLPSTLRVIE